MYLFIIRNEICRKIVLFVTTIEGVQWRSIDDGSWQRIPGVYAT